MLLNSSNIQTVGCLLLSVIISIFTWYSSRGSNAHSQQQTAFISRQTCVESHWLLLGKSLYKTEHPMSGCWHWLAWLSRGSTWLPADPIPSLPGPAHQWKWFQALPARVQLSRNTPKCRGILYKAQNGKYALFKVWCFWEQLKSIWTYPVRSTAHKFLSVLCLQQKSGEILFQSRVPITLPLPYI